MMKFVLLLSLACLLCGPVIFSLEAVRELKLESIIGRWFVMYVDPSGTPVIPTNAVCMTRDLFVVDGSDGKVDEVQKSAVLNVKAFWNADNPNGPQHQLQTTIFNRRFDTNPGKFVNTIDGVLSLYFVVNVGPLEKLRQLTHDSFPTAITKPENQQQPPPTQGTAVYDPIRHKARSDRPIVKKPQANKSTRSLTTTSVGSDDQQSASDAMINTQRRTDEQYPWTAVYLGQDGGLMILARSVSEFRQDYSDSVLEWAGQSGFSVDAGNLKEVLQGDGVCPYTPSPFDLI